MSSKNRTNRKKPNKGNRRKRNRRQGQTGQLIVNNNPRFPNDIKMRPIHNRVIRYLVTAPLQGQAMTAAQMQSSILATTSGSTTAIRIFDGCRIRRISMYFAAQDFSSSANNLSFSWRGATNGPEMLITDRGTATRPACIKVVPPEGTPASWWYDSTSPHASEELCRFWVPTGAIVDIDFDFIIGDATTGTVTLGAAATSTGIGYLRLFGTTTGFDPDGGVTIVRI